MFIHLGEEIVIRSKDVVAIIDGQLLESSSIMAEFIQGQEQVGRIKQVSTNNIKSIIVTKKQVYFSPLSSVTLKRRSQMITELDLFNE
ncbi:extracellular matrix regulator RemB [Bacillus solimangrovi]|uniref:DUF370 domain-containing protein n=1 Tax=Bacillus solimangrovi TaxID=1305675 RepID=A0A1E5LD46_9BACI|nr:extracellular matrix/biofilm biosynthesis regulator RemA family protein [Bacillus solimangrovi]OEH91993.1 DUF370 domain-containing protein [Bacillus solimangrovi]